MDQPDGAARRQILRQRREGGKAEAVQHDPLFRRAGGECLARGGFRRRVGHRVPAGELHHAHRMATLAQPGGDAAVIAVAAAHRVERGGDEEGDVHATAPS